MNLINVNFRVTVGQQKLRKCIPVQVIMPPGAQIKLVNCVFDVKYPEQDLDAYLAEEHLLKDLNLWCETVYLQLSAKYHHEEEHPNIVAALVDRGFMLSKSSTIRNLTVSEGRPFGPEKQKMLTSMSITELFKQKYISAETARGLNTLGVATLQDVTQENLDAWLGIRGLGKKTKFDLISLLRRCGRVFPGD